MAREVRTRTLAQPPVEVTDAPARRLWHDSPELDERLDEPPVIALQERDPTRYQVVAEHGRGGVGRVLRATDREFGRDVALKELLYCTPQSEARFVREAVITSRLEHPGIVPVHETGRWPDGTPYYTMKLVSGRPLRDLIDEAQSIADRLTLLDRLLAVADATAYAHGRGVIHRDLKPSNIIVGDYGETLVVDWGLAKYISDPDEDGAAPEQELVRSDLTRTGAVLGTPAYMAPEQGFGGTLDERTDVYALGAILLDVLAGRCPATDAEIDRRMPAALVSIARRAMEAVPDDRYASASEFGDELRRFLAGARVVAHRYTGRELAARWLTARRRLVQGAAAVLVALFAASMWFLARESRLRGNAEVARVQAEQARVAAEAERDRADRQTLALVVEQGRAELAAGHPFRAAPFLAEAYRRDPDAVRVRWLVSEALRALDSLTAAFQVNPPGRAPTGMPWAAYSVSFAPDDREVVIGHDRAISFWDPSGALRRRVPLSCCGGLVHHDRGGRRLLTYGSGGGDSPIRITSIETGRELARVASGEDTDFVAWTYDGRHVATVHTGGRLEIWRVGPPAARRFSLSGLPPPVFGSVAMSPDGSTLAARGRAEVILVSLASRAIRRLPVPGEDVQQLSWSPDSRRLLATLADRSIRTWEVAAGALRAKLGLHLGAPTIALFSGDGSMVASADTTSLHLWDAESALLLARFDIGAMSGTFAHERPRLVTATLEGQVRIWELPRDRWARPLPGHLGPTMARYAAGGSRIVTVDAGPTGHLRVWKATTGELERVAPLEWDPQGGLAVSADGGRVAYRGADGRVRVVATASGEPALVLDAGGKEPGGLAFSPDGRRLATTISRGRLQIWSARDGAAEVAIQQVDEAGYVSVQFSPDGRSILAVSEAAPARIWDSRTGRLLRELPDSMSHAAAYSPDGRRIVTGGRYDDEVPRIWDASTGTLVARLGPHGHLVHDAAFSPDASLVATASGDGAIQIWDAATGAELRAIEGPTEVALPTRETGWIQSIEFSPDGRRLLATGHGYALIWNVEVDRRSPAQVAAVVAAKSPWRLVDGRLVLR